MFPGFISRGPAVSEDEITAFEARCGFRLPADYRAFLLHQNGGERSSSLHNEDDSDENWTVCPQYFFSLGAAVAFGWSVDEVTALDGWDLMTIPELFNDLDVKMRFCRGDGRPGYYPAELLPIAVGYHDDLLLLQLDGPDAGVVYYTFDPDGYCEWHCHRVAESFGELMRHLT